MGHQPGAYELGLRIIATWARVSPGVRAPEVKMCELANELRSDLQRDNARLLKRVWKVAWHPENSHDSDVDGPEPTAPAGGQHHGGAFDDGPAQEVPAPQFPA